MDSSNAGNSTTQNGAHRIAPGSTVPIPPPTYQTHNFNTTRSFQSYATVVESHGLDYEYRTRTTTPIAIAHDKDEEKKLGEKDEKSTGLSVVRSMQPIPEAGGTPTIAEPEPHRYLHGQKLVLVTIGFLLGDFVATLDQSMVSTALPQLASQFHALDRLTWVISAFFLTEAAAMLTFGQILTIAPSKWVFAFCFFLFKVASLICALSPKLELLIFGRTLQGIAVSGGLISVVTMISQVARLEVRPIVFGSFAAVGAVSSVAGPMLGGVLTDNLSWRWCFYINIPICAVSLLVVLLFMPVHPPLPNASLVGKSELTKWFMLDWIGVALSLGMTVSFVLALQWGGVIREWHDKVEIALFCTSGVLFILFMLWQRKMKERALMPLHLLKRRTQLAGGICSFFTMTSFIVSIYYLPFFYQSKGHSASQSGIDIVPFMMSMVTGIILGGAVTSKTGRYWYSLIIGPLIAAVGGGLLFTINERTSNANVIGFQILLGFGIGVAYQMPLVAVQAEYALEPEKTPQAMSLLLFFQLMGGVCGITIAGAVFGNQLEKQLGDNLAVIPPDVLKSVRQSVTAIFGLSEPLRSVIITAYVDSLKYAFILIVPACAMISISGLFVKNWNLNEDRNPPAEEIAPRDVEVTREVHNPAGQTTPLDSKESVDRATPLDSKESVDSDNSRPTVVGSNSGSSVAFGSGFNSNVMDAQWYINAINNV